MLFSQYWSNNIMTLTKEQAKAYYFAARKRITVYESTTHKSVSVSCLAFFSLKGRFILDGKNATITNGLLVVE
jgi:hypothetical protein